MKLYIYTIASALLLLLSLGACRKPELEDSSLLFDAKAGTQTMNIRTGLRNWKYDRFYLEISANGSQYEPTPWNNRQNVDPKEISEEMLSNGTHQIRYAWLTIQIPKDRRSVIVTVEPNTTGKRRWVSFRTIKRGRNLDRLDIIQEAKQFPTP